MQIKKQIANAITKAALRVLPGIRAHEIPSAESVDSITQELSEMRNRLNAAGAAHIKRSIAQAQAAEAMRKDAITSEDEARKAWRRADKLADIIG